MALYAFDGTGDRWNPGTRWNLADVSQLDTLQKAALLETVDPDKKAANGRYLTNVVFFYKEYVQSGLQAEYFPGVGSGAWFETQTGKTLDFIFGGAFGIGAKGIVRQAFGRLKRNYSRGDTQIDIIGYSRGAAISRMFANKIFEDYQKIMDKTGNRLLEPPEIRFLGLFDTVASFGNPLNNNELFFKSTLPSPCKNVFHAMSLDLNRPGFGLDRIAGEAGGNTLEVWFRGGHGDVGGNSTQKNGDANRLRTNIALTFMLKKARASGVELRDSEYKTDIHAPISLQNNFPGKDDSRVIRENDILHYSLFDDLGQEIQFPDQSIFDTPLSRSSHIIEEKEDEFKRISH